MESVDDLLWNMQVFPLSEQKEPVCHVQKKDELL